MTVMHDSEYTPAATQHGTPQHGAHHTPCPVCQAPITQPVMQLSQIPIHCNLLWPSRAEAMAAPKGDMHLTFCAGCGHFFNAVFDPARMDYDQTYENSLHFSPRFQQYIESLAADLIERHDLHQKRLIEIGCGQGDFLRLLCEQGQNRGLGFDPAYVPDAHQPDERVHIVQDFYSEKYAHEAADFIGCRHTLEHIHDPIPFMQTVRRSIGKRSDIVVFFEVPNALFTVRDLGIWDLIYEHCAYFTEYSLTRLFLEQGFTVHDVRETYGGQFLCIEATPRAAAPSSDILPPAVPAHVLDQVDSFTAKYRDKVSTMGRQLESSARTGQKVVAWGSGSKGVTFLNVFQTQEQIPYIVDLNPRKQGMFVAGTGQRIVAPEFLKTYQPDVVIVMNAIYADEIRTMLQDLHLEPEILLA